MAAVAGRIEEWRRERGKWCAMPEELWTEAVALAEEDGVSQTARGLGVNYATLRWRVTAAQLAAREAPASTDGAGPEHGFVELLPPRGGEAARLDDAAQAVRAEVDLSDAGGSTMTIRVFGDGGLDVVGLARAFWSRGS